MVWEETLYEKCEEICKELGYEVELIDDSYQIFHELFELDEDSEEYRRKVSSRRREGVTDLLVDLFGNKDDAERAVNEVFNALDVVPKE